MGINYASIKSLFEQLKIKDQTSFDFQYSQFTIWITRYTKREYLEDTPAFIVVPSTINRGFDIYLPSQLRLSFRKPVCLHEVVEAIIYNDPANINRSPLEIGEVDTRRKQAHIAARKYDGRYAQETLSDQEYHQYLTMRDNLEHLIDHRRRFRDVVNFMR